MRLRNKKDGFTVIELLILIVIIGVMVTLVFTTLNDIKQKARNTERQTDIKLVYRSLELYYAQNAKYPTLANMNDGAWRTANMKGFDQEDLRDPSSGSFELVAKPAARAYAYEVKAADDSECDNVQKDCTKYTLTATFEGKNSGTFSKNNLN